MHPLRRTLTVLVLAAPVCLGAQAAPPPNEVTLSAGAFQWDYDGTGTDPMIALGLGRHVGRFFVFEGDVGYSRWTSTRYYANPGALTVCCSGPLTAVRSSAMHLSTELAGQLQFPINRFAPYIGIGGGAVRLGAVAPNDYAAAWKPTLFVSTGARIALGDRFGLRAELRVRSEDPTNQDKTDFFSNAEYRFGLSHRF